MLQFYFYRRLPFQYFWYKNSIKQYKITTSCTQMARPRSGTSATLILNNNPIAQQCKHFTSDSSTITNSNSNNIKNNKMENKNDKIAVNKEELKKRLTPLQYQVTQEAATERPFTGCYNKHYEKGIYQCIVCHQDLFSSDTKYDSGCGWPAFNDVLDKGKVTLHRDASIPGGNILLLIKHPERIRTEVRCSRCNAHMGHVFEDGPKPTRKRYCINSASIDFVPAKTTESIITGAAAAAASTVASTPVTASTVATIAGVGVGPGPVVATANINIVSAIAQQ